MNLKARYVVPRRNKDGTARYYWIRAGRCERLKATNEIDAAKEAKPFNDEMDAGETRDAPAEGTIAWAVTLYRNSDKFKTKAASTRKLYEPHMQALEKGSGRRALSTLTPGAIDDILSRIGSDGVKVHCATVIRHIVTIGSRHLYVSKQILEGIELPKSGTRDELWAPEDEAAMYIACDAHGSFGAKIKLGCVVMLYTGQRPCDTVYGDNALKWRQFDGEWIRLTQTKTGQGLDIPCHFVLLDALTEARRTTNSTLIVSKPDGSAFTDDSWHYHFNRIRKQAKLEHLQARDFRRTAATRLGEIPGMADADIETITGHRPGSRILNVVYRRRTARHAKRVMNLWEADTKDEQSS